VARLLQKRPAPEQVKALLRNTTKDLAKADPLGRGEGLLDVKKAAGAATPGTAASAQPFRPATGLGTLERARGSAHLLDGDIALEGEQDIFGNPWDGRMWSGRMWSSELDNERLGPVSRRRGRPRPAGRRRGWACGPA
jgi:hypothetical protein